MSGHTPSPWHVIPAYASAPAGVQNSGGEIIADVFCPKGFNPLVVMVEVEANARLIAAAPDLLAALKAMVAFQEDDTPVINPLGELNRSLAINEMVRAAIAKAEGRP